MNYLKELRYLLRRIKRKLKLLFFYNVPFDEEELLKEQEETKEVGEGMAKYPHNYIEFPFNIYEPDKIIVGDSTYTRYRAKFNGLHDLYTYLSSNPRLNREVFRKLHS